MNHVSAWLVYGSEALGLNLCTLSLGNISLGGPRKAPDTRKWEVCVVGQEGGIGGREGERGDKPASHPVQTEVSTTTQKLRLKARNQQQAVASPPRRWEGEISSTETRGTQGSCPFPSDGTEHVSKVYISWRESWKGLSVSSLFGLPDATELGFGNDCVLSNLVLSAGVQLVLLGPAPMHSSSW